jgi:3-phenylpropionate/trans-cinnamate dioxygenase ferredoxin component
MTRWRLIAGHFAGRLGWIMHRAMTETTYSPALALDDLAEGSTQAIELAETQLLLCHDGGQVYAIENRCSHMDEPLTCGRIRRGWIACPAHGARFDLATGEPMNPPASAAIRTFPVRIVNGIIEVAI